ncbi:MAG: transcription-repair coupling factor [Bacteroidales bacterium]|nr:transcription-repair coupling factor [Bacteroidales bacterium]
MENIISSLYKNHPGHDIINQELKKNNHIQIKGLNTSAIAFFISSDKIINSKPTIYIANSDENAAYLYNDFQSAENNREVFFYPFSHKKSALKKAENIICPEFILSKTEVLDKISKLNNYIIVTYPEAIAENVISANDLIKNTLELEVGNKINTDFVIEVLESYNFTRTDFVFQPGQYSQRGSIIDIFSFSNDNPYRIDFFGEEIDSIRTFDTINQLSIEKKQKITIIPNICKSDDNTNKIPFLKFISQNSIIWFEDSEYCKQQIDFVAKESSFTTEDNDIDETIIPQFVDLKEFNNIISNFTYFDNSPTIKLNCQIKFNISIQPNFQKNFALLSQNLIKYQDLGYKTYISAQNEKQFIRLHDIFNSDSNIQKVNFENVIMSTHEGFVDNDLKLCCYSDHQIFERYLKYRLKEAKIKKNKQAITLNEMNSLKPGDYVVHIDHGIGTFGGLETIENNGHKQEVVRLVYKDNDILYVSIHALHKISKYKGSEGEAPSIYKLGSNTWNKLKQKAKSRVKDIAQSLIKLYAQRKQQKGFAFSPDSYLQQALEASFIYEDTPDQEKATAAVKQDMESIEPMDRLICGDVGFGKTEVAIRAAFKAATDSKQVAVLVPTTILALQHYNTFKERLKELPCNVEYISRLRSTKDIKNIQKRLANGEIDILIGTHKIIGKDIVFKDLGLLIIDEEQKFGVAVKEKLKQMKLNVDTLTLSATPIPRTLQFSLLGARDLSIINTPPPNRYPIITEVHTFNQDIIKEAIDYELDRNGQVFIIQNKIKDLYKTEQLVNKLCPKATTITAHGQMDGKILENIMLGFINNEADVLICTTIIESGLDIPNANTIIVFDAQNFGLSELHQLRGRVGRSNKKAFCYLMAHPEENMTPQARQRLKAIESFSELGSGFNVALQDLDIRGAGNMLGGEQSGFITEIGMETYQKILDEAITEIKDQEYKESLNSETKEDNIQSSKNNKKQENLKFVTDCTIDTDMELLLPDNYVENITERVKIYKKLDNTKDEESLSKIIEKLIDRFGKIPEQTEQLFNIVRLRWIAIQLGMERIILKNQKMICYLVSDQESSYYSSPIFGKILMFLQNCHNNNCRLKPTNGKASLVVENIDNPLKALKFLKSVNETQKK